MTRRVLHLAVFTVRQWRSTSLLLLLYLALIIPALIPLSSPGGEIVFGMGTLGGVLFACFLGAAVVKREVESRTVFAILAKPISQEMFFVGKVSGGLILLATYWFTLIVLGGILGWLGNQPPGTLFWQCATLSGLNIYLYFTVACGLSGVFSVVGASGLALFLGFSMSYVRDLTHRGPAFVQGLNRILYLLLPAYDRLVFEDNLRFHIPASTRAFLLLATDTFLYATVILAIAGMTFGRRDISR